MSSRKEVTMASTLLSPVIKRSLLNTDSASLAAVPFLEKRTGPNYDKDDRTKKGKNIIEPVEESCLSA